MVSELKVRANRANSKFSTGPKTAQGRARSAQNAFRHGLSLPVHAIPALSEEVEAVGREIAGPDANAEIKELARQVAEAQVDLCRVRYARHQLLSDKMSDRYYESRADTRKKMAVLRELLPINPSKKLLRELEAEADPEELKEAELYLAALLLSTQQGPDKFALILLQESKQLLAMDRYERRALSRRKFAIRALDGARR